LKSNFFDYYEAFVKSNRKYGNRHPENSLKAFRTFIGNEIILAQDITEKLCRKFQYYLFEKYEGETPSGYFMRFKRVIKKATKDGYFRNNPSKELPAKVGGNKKLKEILTAEEYSKLMNTPCLNHEHAHKSYFVTDILYCHQVTSKRKSFTSSVFVIVSQVLYGI
jgi:integrase/recombinase XerD